MPFGYPYKHPSMRTQSIDYQDGLLLPTDMRLTPDYDPVPADHGGDIDYGRPEVIDEPEQPGRWTRLGRSIAARVQKYAPGIVEGAIAGGATQGSGPSSIFRAAEAGMGVVRQRQQKAEAAEQRRQATELQKRKIEADEDRVKAQAEIQRRQAEIAETRAKAQAEREERTAEQYRRQVEAQERKANKKELTKAEELIELHNTRKKLALDMGLKEGTRDFQVYLAKGDLDKPDTPKPTKTEELLQIDDARVVLAKRMGIREGTAEYKHFRETGKPLPMPKPEKPDKTPVGTPGQFAALDARKDAAMIKARKAYDDAIADLQKEMPTTDTEKANWHAKRQAITKVYDDLMGFIQKGYERGIESLGRTPNPRGGHPAGGGGIIIPPLPPPPLPPGLLPGMSRPAAATPKPAAAPAPLPATPSQYEQHRRAFRK